MTRLTILALAVLGFSATALAQAPAGDATRGANRVQMCQGCHGIEGFRTAFPEVYSVPRIAGQHPQYFVAALQAYKSGARNHPSMKAIAATLSDQDIADLAAYYAHPDEKVAGGRK
jgi:cytochrome c553